MHMTLDDAVLRHQVSLSDAYKIMERMLLDYLARGDMPLSDLIYCFIGVTADGGTTDPAALGDFLKAARDVTGYPAQ